METEMYDVAIIGAGLVGTAIARQISGGDLRVVVLESHDDVGNGTSKANTAIWHTGFDCTPGTLESRLVRRGHALLGEYAQRANIALERTGAIMVAWNQEELAALPKLQAKAIENGYDNSQILSADQVRDYEQHLGEGVLGGLMIPDEGIMCTWTTSIAFATQALSNGVEFKFLWQAESFIRQTDDSWLVIDKEGRSLTTRYIINSAGLHSDDINRSFGHGEFNITARKGQLLVFDKLSNNLVSHIILPIPTKMGKGVLVSPTVYGNVIVGPTAEDQIDKSDRSITAHGIDFLLNKAATLMPELLNFEVTAMYAGLRAATEHSDYQISSHPEQNYVCVGGIRSTGLTASMSIAEYVAELLTAMGVESREPDATTIPVMPTIGERFVRPFQRDDMIERDKAYGEIVCHCEHVSRGEIRDALNSPIPARSLDGVKRRTRATLGRCQGFYCKAQVRAMIEGKQ